MGHWHIIRCTSGQEGRAERYLERMGYPHGWHPTEKVRFSESVYQRMLSAARKMPAWAMGRRPKRYKVQPIVTGYVFLPADEVNFREINGHHPGVWMDVLRVEGEPYRLTDDQMAAMKETPSRLRELVEEMRKAEEAAWRAKMPEVDKKAQVTEGVFEGFSGVVTWMDEDEGEVKIDIGLMFGVVTVPARVVQKVA